jgi:histone acetyltransferase SAS3
MAAAMLMEEELQNSISEEDAEFEEDDELAVDMLGDEFAANNQLHNGMLANVPQSEDGEGEDEEDGEDEMLSDEDAEGEEDEEMVDSPNNGDESEEEEGSEGGSEGASDGEGVGAVKIQPGLDSGPESLSGSEDDEGSVASGDDGESKDSTDAEVEVEWDPAAEDDEEEPANPNRCMYVSLLACQPLVVNGYF